MFIMNHKDVSRAVTEWFPIPNYQNGGFEYIMFLEW